MSPGRRLQKRPQFTPLHALLGAGLLFAAGILVSSYQDRFFRAQQNRQIRAQGDILAAA